MAMLAMVAQPHWWTMPSVDCDNPSTVQLIVWATAVERLTPLSAAQCKLFNKRSGEALLKLTDLLKSSVMNLAMYPHQRTAILEMMARIFLAAIFTQLMDGVGLCEAVLLEAHFAVHSQLDTSLRSAAQQAPTLNRLLVAFNNASTSPERRLLTLIRSFDSVCLHHKAQDAVHGEFYGLAPQAGENPLVFFDRVCEQGGIRGFGERDMISLFNQVLRKCGEDMAGLVDLLDSSDMPMIDVASLRNRLARLNSANRPFKIKGGRRGADGDDAMLTVEVVSDTHTNGLHGQAATAQSSAYIETRDDAPAGTLSNAVSAAKEINQSLTSNTGAAIALTKALREARSASASLAPVGGALAEQVATRDAAFFAAGGNPPLQLDKVYPVVLPGAAVPTSNLVGAECGACALDRPTITNWVLWDEHPEWRPEKPGGKSRLPIGYGWCHNPAKCKCLYARVRQHVAAHPEDARLLEPAAPPTRRQ